MVLITDAIIVFASTSAVLSFFGGVSSDFSLALVVCNLLEEPEALELELMSCKGALRGLFDRDLSDPENIPFGISPIKCTGMRV